MDEDEYTKWRDLIGDFMLAFAKAEGELNGLIIDLTSNNECEDIIKNQFKFKARQSRAKALVNDKVSDSNLAKRVNTLLDQLLNFAENERNLIAHNPLELSLKSLFEDISYFEIRSQKNNDKYITYEKLKQKYEQLYSCLKEFESACYSVSCLLHP